jgi:hypothetical protein
MADQDPRNALSHGGGSPSPARLVIWTVIGAVSGLVLYQTANDIVMGRASLPETAVGAAALAVALLAVRRLARLLA